MNVKAIALLPLCVAVTTAHAFLDVAKLGVLVLDESTGLPVKDVLVRGGFENYHGWLAVKGAPPPNEDFVRTRLIVDPEQSQEPEPFIEEEDELPEEEPQWDESDEYDPDAEKAAKNKERAARQKKLADEAKKRDARSAEQRLRQEEAARLGINVREGQSLSEADIFRERVRQEEAQLFKVRQEEERRRSENEAMRNYRERMERSQSFIHLDRQHIDMSREGIGPRGSESVPPDTNFATPSDHSYTYSNPSEARSSQSPQRDSDTAQNPQQAFIPMQFTPTGVSPVAAAQHQWYQTAESNAKIYSALSTNRSELEHQANPIVVSSAVEAQMRFNVDRARLACLEAQGTDQYQELVHNYIQERNSLSQFSAEVRNGYQDMLTRFVSDAQARLTDIQADARREAAATQARNEVSAASFSSNAMPVATVGADPAARAAAMPGATVAAAPVQPSGFVEKDLSGYGDALSDFDLDDLD